MARIAVITDRTPHDLNWKGPMIWDLILRLCESQHDVMVFSPLPPELLAITHNRLKLVQPAPSWGLVHFAKWLKALWGFQPDVIQTFPLEESTDWSLATIWPGLNRVCQTFPHIKRVSSFFEPKDFCKSSASWVWHKGSHSWTVFNPEVNSLDLRYFGAVQLLPFEFEYPMGHAQSLTVSSSQLLIPAPVHEWDKPEMHLLFLADFLAKRPELKVKINGGWGSLLASERKQGWRILLEVMDRVEMLDELIFEKLVQEIAQAKGVFVHGLRRDSWRLLLVSQLAMQMNKRVFGTPVTIQSGSTSNSLSRLYSTEAHC